MLEGNGSTTFALNLPWLLWLQHHCPGSNIIVIFVQRASALANDYFQFKAFTIRQQNTAMKVGTDGVLLGAWAAVAREGELLDVGTGTGLIAIMLAQRSRANITAIEIDREAYLQACKNIQECRWHQRITPIHQSFRQLSRHTDEHFDGIVCNPPYFQNTYRPSTSGRNRARNNAMLPYQELVEGSARMLKSTGMLNVILPYQEAERLLQPAAQAGLFCVRRMNILPAPHKKPKRVMLGFKPEKQPLLEEWLTIETGRRHHYTPAYRSLTRDFYLFFE
jgi:tRNA1Val (adenine37-N6)-methyltransferase